MTRNLIMGEANCFLIQKTWDHRIDTNANYKLVIKNAISHFFLPRALQRQKIYLHRVLYKLQKTKIREFICIINNIFDHLHQLPLFENEQGLPDDDILKLVEFLMPCKWQK